MRLHPLFLFDACYLVAVAIITSILVWMLPTSFQFKIELQAIVVPLVVLYIAFLFRPNQAGSWRLRSWIILFIIGFILVVISIQMEQSWRMAMILIVHDKFNQALNELRSHPHSNPLLVSGIAICYASVVAMIRRLLLQIMKDCHPANYWPCG